MQSVSIPNVGKPYSSHLSQPGNSPNPSSNSGNLDQSYDATVNNQSTLEINKKVLPVLEYPIPFSSLDIQLSESSSSTWEEDARRLLEGYRHELAPEYPFVVIPKEKTAQVLLREKPFLYKNVVVAASYADPKRQSELRKDILTDLCQSMIFQGEKSLDILQGLLVFIAWFVIDFCLWLL